MNTLTLKHAGVENTLDQWGVALPRAWYRSRAAGEFQLYAWGADPAIQAVMPMFAWGDQIEIWDGRTYSGGAWTGGTRIFVGYRRDLNGIASGEERNCTMSFLDVWDKLQRTTYQQPWRQADGTLAYTPRCFLFMDIGTSTTPWTYSLTKDQIIDAIDFAHTECNVAVQAGTIDPLMIQPIYPCRAPKVTEVIELCLTSVPDAVTWIDYTTNDGEGNPLPTLHVRQRQNCDPVTLPYADGNLHKSTRIRSREDLKVTQVVFSFQETTTVDGTAYASYPSDVYPPGSTGFAENAVVEAIDLRGASRNDDKCQITATALIDPSTWAFWADKDKTFSDPTIITTGGGAASVIGGSVKIVDHTGTDISTATYPNEFKNGQCASWAKDNTNTPIKVIEAVITANIKYQKKDPVSGQITDNVTNHPVSTRIRLTNSAVGTQTYKTQASGSTAETPPPNLAYLFWCSCNNVAPNIVGGVVTPPSVAPSITNAWNLQWEGEHTIVGQNISTYYNSFNVLNLSSADGGASNWAEMNAAIYEVEYDFFRGTTTIRFGPNKKFTAQQFFANMMMFRTRLMWDDPNVRSTGYDSSGSGTELGKDTRVQDTTGAIPPAKSVHTVSDGTATPIIIQINSLANGGTLQVSKLASGGGIDTTENYLLLKLSDITDPADVVGGVMFRKVPMQDESCTKFYAWVPCSQAIEDTDGSADSFFP